jgi:DMSO reductase family type II enzyme heme b subunit
MTAPAETAILAAAPVRIQPEALLQPGNAAWATLPSVDLHMEPTPLDRQPSAYVREAWASRSYGAVSSVRVSAAVAASHLLLRLTWEALDPRDQVSDNDVYADACGVLFPLDARASDLSTMGSPDQPVTAWHWRAGTLVPFVVVARGLGTATRQSNHGLRVAAERHGGSWQVVFARALEAPGVPLRGGTGLPFGVAAWTGANQERAGIKAHTPVWHLLQLP